MKILKITLFWFKTKIKLIRLEITLKKWTLLSICYLQAKQPKLDISPRPSCPSSPFGLSSSPCRPPPQTMDRKRRAAKLGQVKFILVCTVSEWAAYWQKARHSAKYPEHVYMERPFTRSALEQARILHHILKGGRAHNHLSPFVGTLSPPLFAPFNLRQTVGG